MSSDCVISEYITHISMCIHAWRMHVWSDTATAYDCLCLKASLKHRVTRGFHHRSSDSQHTLPGVAPDITNCTHVVCIVLYQSILYHTHIYRCACTPGACTSGLAPDITNCTHVSACNSGLAPYITHCTHVTRAIHVLSFRW
jgi:hypothetical protein